MTEKQKQKQTQEFVRRVLAKNFNQRLDAETLREVAAKVADAIPVTPVKRNRSKEGSVAFQSSGDRPGLLKEPLSRGSFLFRNPEAQNSHFKLRQHPDQRVLSLLGHPRQRSLDLNCGPFASTAGSRNTRFVQGCRYCS